MGRSGGGSFDTSSPVMLVEGTTDERLAERSNDLYKMLKKETRQHKKPIQYSHVETAQYEKRGDLFNVFVEGGKRGKMGSEL